MDQLLGKGSWNDLCIVTFCDLLSFCVWGCGQAIGLDETASASRTFMPNRDVWIPRQILEEVTCLDVCVQCRGQSHELGGMGCASGLRRTLLQRDSSTLHFCYFISLGQSADRLRPDGWLDRK